MNRTTRRFILIAASLLATGLGSGVARADNVVIGGLLGAGTGALVGQSFGGRDGAIIGGALGAAAGVAIAGDYRSAPRRPPQQPIYYYAQPQVVYSPPQVVYSAPPVYYQRYENNWNDRGHRHQRHHRHDDRHRGHDRGYDYRY